MTTTTTRRNQITTYQIIGLFAVLVWAALVIGAPLAMAILVHIPAGKIGLAIGNIVLAAIMTAPWMVFGLPVVKRFFAA